MNLHHHNSYRHKLLASATGLLVSIAVLSVVEIALRVGGYSYTPPPILWQGVSVRYEIDGKSVYRPTGYVRGQNVWLALPNSPMTDRYGWHITSSARSPAKRKGVTRIAFVGGSTTGDGIHPYPEHTINRLNELAGREAYEGINCGLAWYTAYQSEWVLRNIVLPEWRPHVVVIYHGHNDLLCMPDGWSEDAHWRAAKTRDTGGTPSWLASLRLPRLIAELRYGTEQQPRSGWPQLRMTPDEFEGKLRDIVDLCREYDATPIVIVRPYTRGPRRELYHDDTMYKRLGLTTAAQMYEWRYNHARLAQMRCVQEPRYGIYTYPSIDVQPAVDDPVLWMPDGIHLTDEGNAVLGRFVAERIREKPGLTGRRKLMGTEADYLIDQHFDRKHGEYGDELPPVRSKPLLCGKSWTCRHKNYQTNECRYEGTCAAQTHNNALSGREPDHE